MKIGVMSDTHANNAFIAEAANILTVTEKVDRIYHLGDSYQDSRRLLAYDVPVLGVPGLYDPEYFEPIYEKRIADEAGGIGFLLVHDRSKIKPQDLLAADVVLYGHTHLYHVARDEDAIWCNPGHLKAPIDKQRIPTFALLTIDEGYALTVYIRDIKNVTVFEKKFVL